MWPFKPTPEKLITKLAKLEDRVQRATSHRWMSLKTGIP
jgi:hypothetical protein